MFETLTEEEFDLICDAIEAMVFEFGSNVPEDDSEAMFANEQYLKYVELQKKFPPILYTINPNLPEEV